MPASPVQTFTLMPHPASQHHAVRRIGGQVSCIPGGLMVRYILEGELERIRVPERQTARFADELWRHTCFELFVARKGEAAYHEFNFSPSGEWAAYAFVRQRERIPLADVALAAIDPRITRCQSAEKLELDAVVYLDRLLAGVAGAPLSLGLSAVIENQASGELSYWALNHPLDKPDFHHPEAFVLELDEIRN